DAGDLGPVFAAAARQRREVAHVEALLAAETAGEAELDRRAVVGVELALTGSERAGERVAREEVAEEALERLDPPGVRDRAAERLLMDAPAQGVDVVRERQLRRHEHEVPAVGR